MLSWIYRAVLVTALVVQVMTFPVSHAQTIPMDEQGFTEYFAKRLRQAMPEENVTVTDPLNVAVGQKNHKLGRLYAYCKETPADCGRQIDGYSRSLANASHELRSPPDKTSIRLALYRDESFKKLQATVSPMGQDLPYQTLPGGLVVSPVVASVGMRRLFSSEDQERFRLNKGEAFEAGKENLRRELRPLMEVAKPVPRGELGRIHGNPYDTSRFVLHDTWKPLAEAQNGILIVAIPLDGGIFYISGNSPGEIEGFRRMVRKIKEENPEVLSDKLFRWTPTDWEVVPDVIGIPSEFEQNPVKAPPIIDGRICPFRDLHAASSSVDQPTTAVLSFLVGKDGLVKGTAIRESSGNAELDAEGLRIYKGCRFKAATVNGQPVEDWAYIKHAWRKKK